MALLEVLKFPDSRLRHKGKEVPEVTPELQELADNMLETMYAEKGIGLAAIQVGVEVRLLVIDIRPQGDDDRYDLEEGMTDLEKQVIQPIVIFNPEITKKEGKTTYDEGCLSVPGFYESVVRAKYIEVKGLNREGQPVEYQLDGLLSICMQHEIDHLDGKVFIDRLSPIKSNRIKAKIKKFGYPKPEDETEAEKEPVSL
jgi:peptide deformylase